MTKKGNNSMNVMMKEFNNSVGFFVQTPHGKVIHQLSEYGGLTLCTGSNFFTDIAKAGELPDEVISASSNSTVVKIIFAAATHIGTIMQVLELAVYADDLWWWYLQGENYDTPPEEPSDVENASLLSMLMDHAITQIDSNCSDIIDVFLQRLQNG